MQKAQPSQSTQPMQNVQREHITQPRVSALPAIAAPKAVAALNATATLPAVAVLPATAALPTVAALPATATLPRVAALPATAALERVCVQPATAMLRFVLVLPATDPIRPNHRLDGLSRIAATLRIPIWHETLIGLELAKLRRDPVLRGQDVPRGDGAPVLLIPGFLAGDPSLKTMALWLRRIGYRPCRARMKINVDCTTRAVERLEEELAALVAEHGRKALIVGQSRGGNMARLLAVRRPDLVAGIVTLGSPLADHFDVHPLVRLHITVVGALGTIGVPGLFRYGCGYGDCCEDTRAHAAAPFPKGVGFVSVYSRRDGIVAWHSCLDPHAEHVEVDASHIGMAVHGGTYRAVAAALAGFAPKRRRRPAAVRRAA
jgi:pimeloyl-ACP methyl ester carboxylesterase